MTSLALGSAQFGMDYGIRNKRGRIPEREVAEIIDLAANNNIDTIDTAAAYGESEAILGRVLEGRGDFRIVTKLSGGSEAPVRSQLESSLRRLGMRRIAGCLLHSYESWARDPDVLEELAACRDSGLVEKVGVSVYRVAEAEMLMARKASLDLIQVPYSLIDRRFEHVFPALAAAGVEIHVRSIFMQGVLLSNPDGLEERFAPIREGIRALRNASHAGIDILSLCLGFAAANRHISKVVIGVDSITNLRQNIASWQNATRAGSVLAALPDISSTDERIILPFNWSAS